MQRAGTLQSRGGSYIFVGHFGRDELMELRVRKHAGTDHRFDLRAVGYVDVDDGHCQTRVPLDVRETAWRGGRNQESMLVTRIVNDAHELSVREDAADQLLNIMVEFGLEEQDS